MADRDQLLCDIRCGTRLRPTKTVDKSKPVLLVEGEQLKPIVAAEPQNGFQNSNPNLASTAPPPPPPPPPLSNSNFSSTTLPKRNSKTGLCNKDSEKEAGDSKSQTAAGEGDRDALMHAIRQGVSLRKIKDGDMETKKSENHDSPKSDQPEKSIVQKQKSPPGSSNGEEAYIMKRIEVTQIRPSLIKQNCFYQNSKSKDAVDSPGRTRHDSAAKLAVSENGNASHDIVHVTKRSSPQTEAAPRLEKRTSISDVVANFEKRISPDSANSEKRFVHGTGVPEKRNAPATVTSAGKRNISDVVSNFEKRISSDFSPLEKRPVADSTPNLEKLSRPQKLPLATARSSSSSSENRTPDSIKVGPEVHVIQTRSETRNIHLVKNGIETIGDPKTDVAQNGFMNATKAIWKKRKSIDEVVSPQKQSISKSNLAPVLRFFNGPDYPEPASASVPPPAPPLLSRAISSGPQATPIAIDTNFAISIDLSIKRSSSEYCLQHDDPLPKVDNLRRAYEKVDTKSTDQTSTLRRQQQHKHAPATNALQCNHHRSESLDSGDPSESFATNPKASQAVATKQPARFLPDVGALKQRFEEKAIEERSRNVKPPAAGPMQAQSVSTTSTASSGYSSGSPSPKSSENAPKAQSSQNGNKFQFSQPSGSSTLPHDRHRNRSGNQADAQKSIRSISQNNKEIASDSKRRNMDDGATKGSYVAKNPNSDTVGPFKASMGTLGGDHEGVIKKSRNYYRSAASAKQSFDTRHQNGNANDTATWIVKKGSLPNIVNKYAVCEHLEALHQRKLGSSNATNVSSSFGESPNSCAENSKQAKCNDELLDGEVARLLGIPFEKLKDLRFDIDVNDPEGSLLKIQKRINEVS